MSCFHLGETGRQVMPDRLSECEPGGVMYSDRAQGPSCTGLAIKERGRRWRSLMRLFVILRLYNPLQPFFDKTWRPGEIETITQ
jgi:hypothetical protein